jgi:integrase
VTKVIKVPESHLEVISSPQQESQPTALSQLKYAEPTELYLRDGEVVLTADLEAHFGIAALDMQDGSWHRQTTRQASIEHAVRMACDFTMKPDFAKDWGLHKSRPRLQKLHTPLFTQCGRTWMKV